MTAVPDPPRGRSLGTRLLTVVVAALVGLSAALAVGTVIVQRAYVLGHLDDRVTDAAEWGADGAARHPELAADLSFLGDAAGPAGLLAARLDGNGKVLSAAVFDGPAAGSTDGSGDGATDGSGDSGTDGSGDGHGDGGADRSGGSAGPRDLTGVQRAALGGIAADGSAHTRTVPGLGTYRLLALDRAGIHLLTGLPMDDVLAGLGGLATAETAIAGAGLAVACGVCATLVRRRLRPLRHVAATAEAISRTPFGTGRTTDLARVRLPERDTGPGGEVARIGAALNRLADQAATAHADRVRAEERVRRGEERMRRFLADASHELRTPLAAIAGYAELMNHGSGRVAPELAWRRVTAESARMTGLVEDLLLLARLDEGRPLPSAEVDLACLVTEAVWAARAAGDGHVWRLELPPDAPALVVGDEARLGQVVARLLANARGHTPVGTTVVATVETTPTHGVVRVRDDGPGIPSDLLPVVFEPFTRADTSRARSGGAEGGGSGLGLAVAAAVVAAHGGRIAVESAPGRTEFVARVPRSGRAGPVGELGRTGPVTGDALRPEEDRVTGAGRTAEAV
ncbi:sensor histidine kinase [Streptomyces sp. NPDC056161]|uniref:sensor histidine kinase n=1 Tax=Streptomyces sp. NPDC056161 TaxID=3345732 RepID=UPI0035DD7792